MKVNSPHIHKVLGPVPRGRDGIYDDRLERVLLFGSRARDHAKLDSDYDIAVFIKGAAPSARSERLAAIRRDIFLDTGRGYFRDTVIAGTYGHRTGFMHELRKHGPTYEAETADYLEKARATLLTLDRLQPHLFLTLRRRSIPSASAVERTAGKEEVRFSMKCPRERVRRLTTRP